MRAEVAGSAAVSCGIFGRSFPLASRGQRHRVTLPGDERLDHRPPDWVSTLDATEVSLIPASWSSFSNRWISATRASICVLR